MNRDTYDRGDNALGEGLEVQTFPRRKKRRGKGWIVALILILGLGAAFVVYCIKQPEEQPFTYATETPSLDQGDADDAPDETPGIALDAAESKLSGAASVNAAPEDLGNPIARELDALDLAWRAAASNIKSSGNDEAFLSLDVAHADIWQYLGSLAALKEHDGVWQDPNGSLDGSVEPVPDVAGEYAFALNVDESDKTVQIRGRVDTKRNALYFIVKNEKGKTLRFFECVRVGGGYFAQLLSGDGPYKGILFLNLQDDAAVRCAYVDGQNYAAPEQIYKAPPKSWESFSASARQLFSADAPSISDSGATSADASDAENADSAEMMDGGN